MSDGPGDTATGSEGATAENGRRCRVLDLPPLIGICQKPEELIQVRGHAPLNLQARRILTILWCHAHEQGVRVGRDYTIALSALKTAGHHGTDGVRIAIRALMQTVLTIHRRDGSIRQFQLLGGNDLDAGGAVGTFTFSLDWRLVELLEDSYVWGRIDLDVILAITSKYALSFYENLCLRVNLSHKRHEVFSMGELREMLGIKDGKHARFATLGRDVLEPARAQINALAHFWIVIECKKTGKRITHFRIWWIKKTPDERRDACSELRKSYRGRAARIRDMDAGSRAPLFAGRAPAGEGWFELPHHDR